MKDERTYHDALDKSQSEQHTCVGVLIFCVFRMNWPYPPTTSGSYGLLVGLAAGRQADEIRMDFEIFKILYRVDHSDFILFNITAILIQC